MVEDVWVHRQQGPVLHNVTLQVNFGEVLGVLGPNGAGKTTLMNTVVGLLPRSSGWVTVGGVDPAESPATARRMVGYAGQEIAVFPGLRVIDNVWHWARLTGAAAEGPVDEVLEWLHLTALRDRPVHTLSGGEKRRVHCAMAMVSRPRVLMLDEPTVGVDPMTRASIIEYVRGVADRGAAVMYSTHYLAEVEKMADRVLLLHRGRVVSVGTVDEVIATAGRVIVEYQVRTMTGTLPVTQASTDDAAHFIQDLTRQLDERGESLAALRIREPSLDDAFAAVMARQFEVQQ